MTHSSGSIYEIRWNELCPWLILAKALRVSLLIRVLALAWLGVMLTQWGWSVCENVAGNSPHQLKRLTQSPQSDIMDIRELHASERRLAASSMFQTDQPAEPRPGAIVYVNKPDPMKWLHRHWRNEGQGPLIKGWSWLGSPFVLIYSENPTFVSVFFQLLCGLWAIAVWALFGGAIARISARYCTREEIIGPLTALTGAIAKWPATAGAPAIVLVFVTLMIVPLAVLGIFLRVDFFALGLSVLWFIVLGWGVLLAIVLGALWFGWPLMWATIAVERSDAFDAASRTAAYIYQRPIRLIFYIVVASLLGLFGQLVVSGFSAAGDHLADWAVSWGSGTQRIDVLAGEPIIGDVSPTLAGSAALAAKSISFWKAMLVAVAASYPLACLFSSAVAIYLLLRLHVDATEMNEIEGEEPTTSSADNSAEITAAIDDDAEEIETRPLAES